MHAPHPSSSFLATRRLLLPVLLVLVLSGATPAQAAFDVVVNGGTSTTTFTETSDDGATEIDNNGVSNAWRLNNGAGGEFGPSDNLVVNLLDGSSTFDLDLDFAAVGTMTLNVGNGDRTINLTGFSNTIGGDLVINGGTGEQTVELAVNANLTVTGSMTFDLGTGNDTVDEDGNDVAVGGNMSFSGVNQFENDGTLTVGGNAIFDVSAETILSEFDNDGTMNITGDVTYLGNDDADDAFLNDGTTIGGDVVIHLEDGMGGDDQDASFRNCSVAGTLTVTSGDSTAGDSFESDTSSVFGGDISVDFGDGKNTADFRGSSTATAASYVGGSGVDDVEVDIAAPALHVEVVLDGGDDKFTLGASSDLASLFVDFGCGGNDTFIDNLGKPYPFPVKLVNLALTTGCRVNGAPPGLCRGTAGDDVIIGTDGRDMIEGRGGDDYIIGQGGADELCGQGGDDFLLGEGGNDNLDGGGGSDILVGGNGRDRLRGGGGNDDLDGGAGRDDLDGGNGNDDLVDGGLGSDNCTDPDGATFISCGPSCGLGFELVFLLAPLWWLRGRRRVGSA